MFFLLPLLLSTAGVAGTFTLPPLRERSDVYNFFTWPSKPGDPGDYSENLVFAVGDVRRIEWVTEMAKYTIALCQVEPTGRSVEGPIIVRMCFLLNISRSLSLTSLSLGKEPLEPENEGFDWTVHPLSFNLSTSPIFSFAFAGQNDQKSFTSHYFNISDPNNLAGASQSLNISTTTSPKTPVTMSKTFSIHSLLSPTATVTTGKRLKNTNTNSKSVGLGVGVGVGVSLLLLIGIIVSLRITRAKRARSSVLPTELGDGTSRKELGDDTSRTELGAGRVPSIELSGRTSQVAELHSKPTGLSELPCFIKGGLEACDRPPAELPCFVKGSSDRLDLLPREMPSDTPHFISQTTCYVKNQAVPICVDVL
ncbi:hypothetical protein P154DRAFT_603524 [Amniculicola lignicola CBS 123094]|uniref:Mid2 domain-containing protein n=1 Tax=Amniculicola lignicola CBS 123094 TaxID=1392246 RepID=A0A6A5X2Q3_9PLEO|nr:hypothetical protein P154DRAFT_603524 [Amniculicola lignicola CBS 123094]